MTKRKAHIDETSTRRYLNKEMTGAERNAFEKELQKDSFATEAMEGLELLSGTAFDQDLKELKARINKPKKKKRIPYYAAAATILLLVTAGIIWMQLDKQNPVPQMTETKIQPEIETEKSAKPSIQVEPKESAEVFEEKENDAGEQETSPAEKEVAQPLQKSARPKLVAKDPEKRIELPKAEADSEVLNFAIVADEVEVDEEVILAASKSQAKDKSGPITDSNVVRGIIVSADDRQPIPGVSIIKKGTNKGVITDLDGRFTMPLDEDSNATLVARFVGMETNEFQPGKDSNNIIQLEPSELALDEVVTVGYGTQKKQEVTGSVSRVEMEPRNSEAIPVGGYESYNDYLNKNTILPDNYPEKKLVVKLQIELDANGKVETIKNTNSANEEFFNKAKTLVENGPEWQAEYSNNRPVKSTVKLRIVFRKQEK